MSTSPVVCQGSSHALPQENISRNDAPLTAEKAKPRPAGKNLCLYISNNTVVFFVK